jgi:hypothetical protein
VLKAQRIFSDVETGIGVGFNLGNIDMHMRLVSTALEA